MLARIEPTFLAGLIRHASRLVVIALYEIICSAAEGLTVPFNACPPLVINNVVSLTLAHSLVERQLLCFIVQHHGDIMQAWNSIRLCECTKCGIHPNVYLLEHHTQTATLHTLLWLADRRGPAAAGAVHLNHVRAGAEYARWVMGSCLQSFSFTC